MAENKQIPTDEWSIKKTIRLPRKSAGEQNFEYAGVNGKVYQVPCGKEVEVPLPIYEQLVKRQAAVDALEDMRSNIKDKSTAT